MSDIFGLPESQETPDFLKDEAPVDSSEVSQETDTTSAAPQEEAVEQVVEQPQETAAADDQPDGVGEEAEEQAERLYANKYQTVEALEKAYRENRDLQRRTAEQRNQYESYARELAERGRQVEAALQQVVPRLQQYEAEIARLRGQTASDPYAQTEQQQTAPVPGGTPSPEQLQQFVESQVQKRLESFQNEMSARAAAQAATQQAEQAVLGFYEKHGIEPRSEQDSDLYDTVDTLNRSWAAKDGSTVNIGDPDVLEIIWEATQRPALRSVLEKNPSLIDDDAGMVQARFLASVVDGTVTQDTSAVPASQVGQTVGQRKPVTERASVGSTVPNAGDPNDPWEQVKAAYSKDNSQRRESVFGV